MPSLKIVVDGQGVHFLDWALDGKTLEDVRIWLHERLEIPPDYQKVKFMGITLEDDGRTLLSLKPEQEPNEELELHVEDSRIDYLPVVLERIAGGQPLQLPMSRRTDTVGSLKHKVEELLGIPINKLVIRRDGIGCPDGSYLSRYFRNEEVDLQLEVRIDIRLNVYTGESFITSFASHDLISTVQHRVQQRLRVPTYHQELVYDNIVMEPETRLCDHGVRDGTHVQVRLRLYEMTIFLKTLLGQTIVISVTSHDTVLDVKRKVMEKEGIPIDRQRIVFTGIQLHNHERFLSYRIEHESAVHIVLRYGDSFEIAVTSPAGRLRSVEVAPKEVVGYIKRKMLELEGIAVDIQKLYFNDQLLDDDEATMEDCGIVSDSHIQVRIDDARNTQIFVSFRDRRTISLWVDPDYTIGRLKQILATRESLSEEDIEIYFTRVRLDNDRTLRSYVIESNHMLHVEVTPPPILQLTISVQNEDSDDLELEEPNNLTVEGLKRVILAKRSHPIATQQLFFGGRELENQEKLRDCQVVSGSKLDLILASNALSDPAQTTMYLFVKTLTGKTITLETQLSDTVRSLKEKIYEKEGVEIDSQCLVLAGKQMENSETVGSIGVQNQSVIHLVFRVPTNDGRRLTILDNGNRFDVTADLDGTVGDLKRRIEQKENIPVAIQRLVFEGRVLPDEDTLSALNIADGLTLELMRMS